MDVLARHLGEADLPQEKVVQAVRDVVWPLSHGGYDAQLERIIDTTVARFPGLREPLRRELAQRIAWAQQAASREAGTEDAPAVIRRLHDRLRDPSLMGRVLECVGPAPWDSPVDDDALLAVAKDLLADAAAMRSVLPWLTSGEAASGYRLGMALAGPPPRQLRV